MRPGLFVVALSFLSGATATAQSWGTTASDPGVSRPTLVKSVKATYTSTAKAAQLQGWVDLQAVARSDGKVGDVKVVTSCLGRIGARREPNGDPFACTRPDGKTNGSDPTFGLNQQAVKATEQWVFRPGMKGKTPVALPIMIRMNFDLRDK